MFVAYDAFKDPEIARHDVAFRAFIPLLVVGPGEYGKISVVVGKQGGRPSRHLVTFLAEDRKSRRLVIQNRRGFIVGTVTVITSGPGAPEISRGHARVAGQAVEEQVAALYGEIGVFVNVLRVEYFPSRHRMTPFAIHAQPRTVDVLVACVAGLLDF